jgi:predicted  nucleic acid-binding Zn-ribbon protein
MLVILVLAVLVVLVWGVGKAGEPWRKYQEQHVYPLLKEVASAEARRTATDRARRQAISDARLFTRDFRAEVIRHQEAKSEAYNDLNPLRGRKSELHEEMDAVRSSLDSWHRSSKSFFGNKGRKIKDDSFLGWLGLEQTMAHKDRLESRRGYVSSELEDLKGQIADIYESRIKPAKEGIKSAFDDEKRLKRFRKDGLDESHFRDKARELERETSTVDAEISRLKAAISEATEAYKNRGAA